MQRHQSVEIKLSTVTLSKLKIIPNFSYFLPRSVHILKTIQLQISLNLKEVIYIRDSLMII